MTDDLSAPMCRTTSRRCRRDTSSEDALLLLQINTTVTHCPEPQSGAVRPDLEVHALHGVAATSEH